MPHLFSYAKDDTITIEQVQSVAEFQDLFHLPLSTQAYAQFRDLQYLLQDFQLSSEEDH